MPDMQSLASNVSGSAGLTIKPLVAIFIQLIDTLSVEKKRISQFEKIIATHTRQRERDCMVFKINTTNTTEQSRTKEATSREILLLLFNAIPDPH